MTSPSHDTSAETGDGTPALPRAAAVVVAAGGSTRMGAAAGERKPFLRLGDRTVLEHSCAALVAARGVQELVVVAREDDLDRVRALARESPAFGESWRVVAGGATRTDSVRAGVTATDEASELVAIHDAARPLVRSQVVERALLCAAERGAALVATPVRDTIKRAEGDAARATLQREELWAAQTPQVFGRAQLLELLERARAAGYSPTDDAALFERYVGPVPLVEGEPRNFKLTTPEDLRLAAALLEGEDRP